MFPRDLKLVTTIEIELESSDSKGFLTYFTEDCPIEDIIGDAFYCIWEACGWDGFFDLWEW
jgi:hypothetical protein